MNEKLPRITAEIDIDVDTFLKRVEEVADDMGKFYIDHQKFPSVGDTKAVDLWLYDSNKQKDVMVRFYHPSWKPNQIRIEVSADRWAGGAPTYDEYVSAFRDAMCDFPDRYQKLFGSPLTFEIQLKNAWQYDVLTDPAVTPHSVKTEIRLNGLAAAAAPSFAARPRSLQPLPERVNDYFAPGN